MLLKLSNRGQALQKSIAAIIKHDAVVMNKVPHEVVEIWDLDEATTVNEEGFMRGLWNFKEQYQN